MHLVYAFLVPTGKTIDVVVNAFDATEQLLANSACNYSFIGIAMPGGYIIEACDLDLPWHSASDVWSMHELIGNNNALEYVADLEYHAVADVLGCYLQEGIQAIRQIIAQDGKEAVVKQLLAIAGNTEETSYRRRQAARRLAVVLDDDWPFPGLVGQWYEQRVYKIPGIRTEDAAVALMDMHY